jgi:hypothetical protein
MCSRCCSSRRRQAALMMRQMRLQRQQARQAAQHQLAHAACRRTHPAVQQRYLQGAVLRLLRWAHVAPQRCCTGAGAALYCMLLRCQGTSYAGRCLHLALCCCIACQRRGRERSWHTQSRWPSTMQRCASNPGQSRWQLPVLSREQQTTP